MEELSVWVEGPIVIRAGAIEMLPEMYKNIHSRSPEKWDDDELVIVKPVGDSHSQKLCIQVYDKDKHSHMTEDWQ